MNHHPLSPPCPAPDVLADEITALLADELADAWPAIPPLQDTALRERLQRRARVSAAAAAEFVTVRQGEADVIAPGVGQRLLYQRTAESAGVTPRPGEPQRVCLIELAPGARWQLPAFVRTCQHEWLVLRGNMRVDAVLLQTRDYHVVPAGIATATLQSAAGALVLLRESVPLLGAKLLPHTVRDADSGWDDYGPGIVRRILWRRGHMGAYLIHAQPGARVPPHRHEHDEECLMLQGQLYSDDVLLREGEYQLAPAGTRHAQVCTDTGVLVYGHGDLELALLT